MLKELSTPGDFCRYNDELKQLLGAVNLDKQWLNFPILTCVNKVIVLPTHPSKKVIVVNYLEYNEYEMRRKLGSRSISTGILVPDSLKIIF